jgi:hypothetical protein
MAYFIMPRNLHAQINPEIHAQIHAQKEGNEEYEEYLRMKRRIWYIDNCKNGDSTYCKVGRKNKVKTPKYKMSLIEKKRKLIERNLAKIQARADAYKISLQCIDGENGRRKEEGGNHSGEEARSAILE